MVLQQRSNIVLWGWANAGEQISISNSWNGKLATTSADIKGNWKLTLETVQAGGPYEIIIKGENTITVHDVLLGEVWLCSGQSNMEFPLGKQQGWRTGVFDYEKEVAAANEPLMRLFTVKQAVANEPLDNVSGEWEHCTAETAAKFSAVAYYFAKQLIRKTGFPVGMIHSSWGGTPAESWTRKETLESDADFKPILERYADEMRNYPQMLRNYDSAAAGKDATTALKKPVNPEKNSKSPSKLYNAMIHPLIPFTIKGVIWYQGESNSGRAYQYRKLFPAMIKSWREEWGADLPFYFVQIAPEYQQHPEIREAQLLTYRTVPNTGMAVITDAGDSLNVHPRNKQVVGDRLAAWALAKNYGFKFAGYSSPLYKSMQVLNDSVIIQFDFAENGLEAKEGISTAFTIAGADKQFLPGDIRIDGNRIIVWRKDLHQPLAVRFNWRNFFRASLFSHEGLPVSPFRTDDWPGETWNKN